MALSEQAATMATMMQRLSEAYSEAETALLAQLETECEEVLGRYKAEEVRRVQSLLSSDREADLRSVQLWRIRKLAGFNGLGCVSADRAGTGIWWTSGGLQVQKHPMLAAPPRKLRKYIVRTRHFRGTATFGASRVAGHGGGAPIITTTSIDEDDTMAEQAEEGVPPVQLGGGAEKSTLNQAEALSGVDIDGDGDIGLQDAEEIHRPIRTRVWDGKEWLMNWEYVPGALGAYKGADWTDVRLESATSESICLEVRDPDLLADAGGGRIGVAVMAASVGYGWQPVYDLSHSIIGHVYVEIKKKKKSPKPAVSIQPIATPPRGKFRFVPDSKDGLGIRLSTHGVIVGYSNKDCAAEKAGVPVGSAVKQVNGVSVASITDITNAIQQEGSKEGGRDLEWICELPVTVAGLHNQPQIDPALDPAPAVFTVQVGSHYDFEEELKAFKALKQLFTERVDAVILEVSVVQDVAIGLMTRCFHAAVQRAIVERWGAKGRHAMEPAQFGDLMAFLKSYLDFMGRFGWKPTPEFVGVISRELLGGIAETVCLTIAEKIEVWVENCLESEEPLFEGEALRTTLPDDLLAVLAYVMKLTAGSHSVMWMLRVFRCVGDTVANSIPSLFADNALPHVRLHMMRSRTSGPTRIDPHDAQIADEVGALEHAREVAREQVQALSSGGGAAALQTDASAELSRRGASSQYSDMDRILFGGGRLLAAGSIEEKTLHLRYLCRVINNLQRLTSGFEDICKDHFSPLVAETASTAGLLETSSKEELQKHWGDSWTFDDEHDVLRGEKNGIVLNAARSARSRLIIEMGRLIVEADPGAASLLLSVGKREWESKRMMEQLLSEVNPQLNMIATWLDSRELHDVVGEVLSKLIQHYGYQLLSQKRWDEAFDDFGREDVAKCVLADTAMLEARYAKLMADADGNETRKWQQIKTYVVAPLRVVGELMAAGQDGWMERATTELDIYDAGRAARAQPVWQRDDLVPCCQICREEFGFFLHRHHCRYCGWLVCDRCRRSLAVDRWLSSKDPHIIKISRVPGRRVERDVCTSCFEQAPAEMDDLSSWRGALAMLRASD